MNVTVTSVILDINILQLTLLLISVRSRRHTAALHKTHPETKRCMYITFKLDVTLKCYSISIIRWRKNGTVMWTCRIQVILTTVLLESCLQHTTSAKITLQTLVDHKLGKKNKKLNKKCKVQVDFFSPTIFLDHTKVTIWAIHSNQGEISHHKYKLIKRFQTI